MSLHSDSQPSFLQRAKKIGSSSPQTKSPSFLSRAKKVSYPNESYTSDEEIQKDVERSQAQLLSRGAEAILGLPGDLASFATHVFGIDDKYNPLPTSQNLREFSEKATGGYTKPKNQFEEKVGVVIQDIATMALPGAKKYNIARNIGIPVLGNLIKEGVGYIGGSEKQQVASKVGSMVLMDLLSHRMGGAKEYAGNLMREAEKSIPKGMSVSASKLAPALDSLESTLTKGGSRPSTQAALQKISEMRSEIKDGKVNLERLIAFRPSINEAIETLGGFEIQMPKAQRVKAIRNLNEIKKEVIKTGQEYGDKFNPEFSKLWKDGNEAWAAYAQSNKITNFINKHAGKYAKSKALKTLFKISVPSGAAALGVASPIGLGITAATGLTAKGGYDAYKIIHRALKSEALRKYYLDTIKGAASGNIGQVQKNLAILDKKLGKEDHSKE